MLFPSLTSWGCLWLQTFYKVMSGKNDGRIKSSRLSSWANTSITMVFSNHNNVYLGRDDWVPKRHLLSYVGIMKERQCLHFTALPLQNIWVHWMFCYPVLTSNLSNLECLTNHLPSLSCSIAFYIGYLSTNILNNLKQYSHHINLLKEINVHKDAHHLIKLCDGNNIIITSILQMRKEHRETRSSPRSKSVWDTCWLLSKP